MLIDIEVALEPSSQSVLSAARLWLDLDPEAGLDAEVEILLHRTASARFTACFSVARVATPSYFLYRLALHARPRMTWSLSMRERASGKLVSSDSDLIAMPKTWVIGSCALAPAPTSRRETRLVELSAPAPRPALLGPAHPLPFERRQR